MNSSLEIAMARAEALHPIPLITEPMGKYWEQPHRNSIQIDDTHALMSLASFQELHTYSATNPTGAYEGKMWKRFDGEFDRAFRARGGKPEWMLCWYGKSEKPGYVSNNHRKILLVDAELPE